MRAFFKKLRTAVFFRKLLVSYLLILVLLTGILLFLSSSLIGTISNYSRQLAYKEAISYQSSLESNLDALDSLARELRNCREIICIFLESMLIYVMNEFSDSGGHFHGT